MRPEFHCLFVQLTLSNGVVLAVRDVCGRCELKRGVNLLEL